MKINGNPDGGGGGSAVINALNVTSNGSYTAGGGVDGYSPVIVSVPSPAFVTETLNAEENRTYYPSSGVDGFSEVKVKVLFTTESLTATENGTYYPSTGVDGFSEVNVSIPLGLGYSFTDNGHYYAANYGLAGFADVNVMVEPEIDQQDIVEGTYKNLSSLSNNASFVASYALRSFYSLVTVDLPSCSVVNQLGFADCGRLTTVNLPVCSGIANSAFARCGSLTSISIPAVTAINASAFENCWALTSIELPVCMGLNSYAFYGCSNLSTVVLPGPSRCPVELTTFQRTPIAAGNGSIYVNASLLDEYKSAYGWSNYSSIIYPIAEPVIEGYYFSYTPTNLSGMMNLNEGSPQWENISSYSGFYNDQDWTGTIPEKAFWDKRSISFVTFETNANTVYGYAFSSCTTLTSVRFTNLSEGVYIADYAFDGCENLSTVYIALSDYTCTFDPDAFNGTPLAEGSGSIYVPAAVYSDYLDECVDTPFVTQFVSY